MAQFLPSRMLVAQDPATGLGGRPRRTGLLAARVVAVDSSPQGVKVIESD